MNYSYGVTVTFTDYSALSEQLSKSSNIKLFNRLVIQRIYFIMFYNHNDRIIKPILDLFKKK